MKARFAVRRRLVLLAAGAALPFAALAASEALFAYLHRRLVRPAWPVLAGDLRAPVWCIGDSNTAGGGAGPGESYPDQLAARLAEAGVSGGTLNLGMGASTSGEALRLLADRLEHGAPRVVLFWGGVNNGWSLAGADDAALERVYGRRAWFIKRLQALRTYKFLANHLIPRLRSGGAADLEDARQALLLVSFGEHRQVREALEHRPLRSPSENLLLGTALFLEERYAEALAPLEAAEPAYRGIAMPLPFALLLAETRRLAEGTKPSAETLAFFDRFEPSAGGMEWNCFWAGKGWMLTTVGRYAEARDCFDRLQTRSPLGRPLPWARNRAEGRGWAFLLEGKVTEALAEFARATEDGGSIRTAFPAWGFVGRAWVALSRGDREEFARAVEPLERRYGGGGPARVRPWLARLRAESERRPATGASAAPVGGPGVPLESFLFHEIFRHLLAYPSEKEAGELLAGDLKTLDEISRRRGFRLVLMTYPHRNRRENDIVRRFATERGVPLVDLLEEIGDIREAGLVSADMTHPNAEGYRRIAAAAAERLLTDPALRQALLKEPDKKVK